jgi:hypothetical protein
MARDGQEIHMRPTSCIWVGEFVLERGMKYISFEHGMHMYKRFFLCHDIGPKKENKDMCNLSIYIILFTRLLV